MNSCNRWSRGTGRLGRIVVGALTAALVAGCGDSESGEPEAEQLSGVLITLDTTKAGALDFYGKDRDITPKLSELALRSVVFERAHTVAPLTLPSHTSMLTGLYPLRHGVRENGIMSLSREADTLAERAREAGLETAAFVASAVLLSPYGLDQGFDLYDEPVRESGGDSWIPEHPSTVVTDRALAWLREREASRPFFLWVHYFDPHMPYSAPAEFVERAGGHQYRGEVAAMDHDVGRLLDGLEREVGFERMTLAVVADHGEAFYAHGEPTHSAFIYESTMHVPFMIRFADERRAGTRSREIVSVVDLFPTFLEELGLGGAGDVDGRSLASGTIPDDRGVYLESYSGFLSYGWSPLSGWLDAGGKYLHSSEPEFYDLDSDPKEEQDLLVRGDVDPEPYRRAIAELSRLPRLPVGGDVDLDPAQIAQLNALGYAAAGREASELPDPLDPSDRPAPASQTEIYGKSIFALGLAAGGEYHQAIPLLAQVVAVNPRDLNAQAAFGTSLVKVGRFEEALVPLEAARSLGDDTPWTHLSLAIAFQRLGQPERSLTHYRRVQQLSPGQTGVAEAIAELEALTGDE